MCWLIFMHQTNHELNSRYLVFLLNVPRRVFSCSVSLFVCLWFHMWHFCCPDLFLISFSFGVLGWLCFCTYIFYCSSIRKIVVSSVFFFFFFFFLLLLSCCFRFLAYCIFVVIQCRRCRNYVCAKSFILFIYSVDCFGETGIIFTPPPPTHPIP